MSGEELAALVPLEIRIAVIKSQMLESQQRVAALYFQRKQLDAQEGNDERRRETGMELERQMDNGARGLRVLQSELSALENG